MKEHIRRHLFFAVVGCVGGMLLMAFSIGRNIVTRDDVPALIAQYSPYTADAEAIKAQLTQQAQQIDAMQTQIQRLEVGVAQISEKLGVPAPPVTSACAGSPQ
jgi:septal ring factor EnvC (AmiA/AmiB activator)